MTGLRRGCLSWLAKDGSGGPTTLIARPPGRRTVSDFSRLAWPRESSTTSYPDRTSAKSCAV